VTDEQDALWSSEQAQTGASASEHRKTTHKTDGDAEPGSDEAELELPAHSESDDDAVPLEVAGEDDEDAVLELGRGKGSPTTAEDATERESETVASRAEEAEMAEIEVPTDSAGEGASGVGEDSDDDTALDASTLPDWVPDFMIRDGDLDLKVVGVLGVVALLILASMAWIIWDDAPAEITVPGERFGDAIVYRMGGSMDVVSPEYGVPINQMGIVINEFHMTKLEGYLNASTSDLTARQVVDGYGNPHAVFQRQLSLETTRLEGQYKEEGQNSDEFDDGLLIANRTSHVDRETLETIRSDSESNISYTSTSVDAWSWQQLTDWVPRISQNGDLPHGELYVGRTLVEDTRGTTTDGTLKWDVHAGEKILGHDTLRLRVHAADNRDILFAHGSFSYRLDLWLSEASAYPLKFQLVSTGNVKLSNEPLYDQDIRFSGTIIDLTEGYSPVPAPNGETTDGPHVNADGEILPWDNGAPAFGNGSSSLDRNFSLQVAVNNPGLQPGFGSYRAKHPNAFAVAANYTEADGREWNFTYAYQSETKDTVKAYRCRVNESLTNASGEEIEVGNPTLSMDDMPLLLSVTGAEQVLTTTPEVEAWTGTQVDHGRVRLHLRQNIQNPATAIDFSKIRSEVLFDLLDDGQIDPYRYASTDSSGYGYLLTQVEPHSGYSTAVDAGDGLVLFNFAHRRSG